ncbi:ABATE domain-containing protein [Dyella sp. C11]|uniref:CGNR zinc finger domain-containing protein n=1 Tax=Dyella sp. C11 TaxID=2126991 RepID=UPI000D65A43B|nr:ABATE domain-containing protein [Dyella sp. C11]
MGTSNRLPAVFIGDSVALDFLNTLTVRADDPYEWLLDGEALLSWLEQAKLVPDNVLNTFRALPPSDDLGAVATRARELREWFRAFVGEHRGHPLSAAAVTELAPVNRILERDALFSQIVMKPSRRTEEEFSKLELVSQRRWAVADALLVPLAEAIGRFVVSDDFASIRSCEGRKCSMFFLDRRGRRWCSMTTCGNRAKQAMYRERVKGH